MTASNKQKRVYESETVELDFRKNNYLDLTFFFHLLLIKKMFHTFS